jgi:hypothetical protein
MNSSCPHCGSRAARSNCPECNRPMCADCASEGGVCGLCHDEQQEAKEKARQLEFARQTQRDALAYLETGRKHKHRRAA